MTPREWLVSALERLAMPAEAQVRYLTAKGVAPTADELALEFEDALAGAAISDPERSELGQLDRYLSSISGRQFASLWTSQALGASPEWAEIRRLALRALRAMGERT
jgi:hypothetical protein